MFKNSVLPAVERVANRAIHNAELRSVLNHSSRSAADNSARHYSNVAAIDIDGVVPAAEIMAAASAVIVLFRLLNPKVAPAVVPT